MNEDTLPDVVRKRNIDARLATIERAIGYLEETDRHTVLPLLARADFIHKRFKEEPEILIAELKAKLAEGDSGATFAPWKASQNVLLAAGLPWSIEDYKE